MAWKSDPEFLNRDMIRILGADIHLPLTEEQHRAFSKATLISSSTWDSLLPSQTNALVSYMRTGGFWGWIAVGFGKTAISIAIPNIMYSKGLRKILLSIPPNVADQLIKTDLPDLRTQIAVNLPIHILAGKSKAARLKVSKATSGLFIVAHSQWSSEDTYDWLENIQPEGIIFDEAHCISSYDSARTKRVREYMGQCPETEFVALSGTMGKKGMMDYYHLLKWCLKDKIPAPETASEAKLWAAVLDSTFVEYTSNKTLEPILSWAKKKWPEEEWKTNSIASYRKAYKRRMNTTLGIMASDEDQLGVSIYFDNHPVEDYTEVEGWTKLKQLMDYVDDPAISPSGDEINHAIHKFRFYYELSAGFYNKLIWSEPEKLASSRGISKDEAKDLLERAQEYQSFKNEYNAILRKWLKDYSKPGLDTPMIVGLDMSRNGADNVGSNLYEAWVIQKNACTDDLPERERFPERVCPYKVDHATAWALSLKKGEGSITWYYNTAMGNWIFEKYQEAGLDPLMCASGPTGKKRISDKKNHQRHLVVSMEAYYQGLNLQTVRNSHFLQFSRSAHKIEQQIGRNHRTGSPYDELYYTTNFTIPFDHQMFSAVLVESLFQHQAGIRQKLIYGNYVTTPKVFPSSVLREQGILSGEKQLTLYQRTVGDLKFGNEEKKESMFGPLTTLKIKK